MLATIAAVLGIFYAALFLIAGSIIYTRVTNNEKLFDRLASAPGLRHLSSAAGRLRARREYDREPATV